MPTTRAADHRLEPARHGELLEAIANAVEHLRIGAAAKRDDQREDEVGPELDGRAEAEVRRLEQRVPSEDGPEGAVRDDGRENGRRHHLRFEIHVAVQHLGGKQSASQRSPEDRSDSGAHSRRP